MKICFKTIALLIGAYLLLWLGVGVYFSYAERHEALLEANLSSLFKRPVSIGSMQTSWSGLRPVVQITDFSVAGEVDGLPALSFQSMTAKLDPVSLLSLWPRFEEFVVERPTLEVVSLPTNQLQVGGLTLVGRGERGININRLLSWLLNHKGVAWHDGQIIWRKANGAHQQYNNISFIYERDQQIRTLAATTETETGLLALRINSNGDVIAGKDWDASLEVLGEGGRHLVLPKDLSMQVKRGHGQFNLTELDVERVQEFLLVLGFGEAASWLFESGLGGRLQDVDFRFAGSLLEFDSWQLDATARNVNFQATEATPGLENLQGRITATHEGGEFEFQANNAKFDWPKWYTRVFAIDKASGKFYWHWQDSGALDLRLVDGYFEDDIIRIRNFTASTQINQRQQGIEHLADLFTIPSVDELEFKDGAVVLDSQGFSLQNLVLQSSAQFDIKSLPGAIDFFPNIPRLAGLIKWWKNAYLKGQAEGGEFQFTGRLASDALQTGAARLAASSTFKNVEIDYGYQRDWPRVRNASGVVKVENENLTIVPNKAWIGSDELQNAKVTIGDVLQKSPILTLNGELISELTTIAEFLLNGPFIKPENRTDKLPVTVQQGRVFSRAEVSLPLNKPARAVVNGVAKIVNGQLLLPGAVPVDKINGTVSFTEKSAQSENLEAIFLDGISRARLITVEAAQPPVLKITGQGSQGLIARLQPWLGRQILSLVKGRVDWQGAVTIDGPKIFIEANSDMIGAEINAIHPLNKRAQQARELALKMVPGNSRVASSLDLAFGDSLSVSMRGDLQEKNSLYDRAVIRVAEKLATQNAALAPGMSIYLDVDQLDVDQLIGQVIDLAAIEGNAQQGSAFLDAMRNISIESIAPRFLGRDFGALTVTARSSDGQGWLSDIAGDNVMGVLRAYPRQQVPSYQFDLSTLSIPESDVAHTAPEPIDKSLEPSAYPQMELAVKRFALAGKPLGRLRVVGMPTDDQWLLQDFVLSDPGIETQVSGGWSNDAEHGSFSEFTVQSTISEAGDVMDEMQLNNLIDKGEGQFSGKLNWRGAPHEFDFTRLNGDFDLFVKDGELVQVESGAGRFLGLLNINSITRRLSFDFRDLASNGLAFDRMRYAGLLAEGQAIMREAFILTPSAFIHMQGKIDLDKELIDMEMHVAPDLGGNLTLLSTLANPAAGAVVYLTQRLFRDEMRASSFRSYRANGSWDDFELVEFAGDETAVSVSKKKAAQNESSSR